MAKSVNKVILIGNLGKDPESEVHPQRYARGPFHPGDERAVQGQRRQLDRSYRVA